MSSERAVVCVRLKLRFHDLPFASAEDDIRTFMQRLEHVELGFCDMQDVFSTVEAKLAQLGVPQHDYRVLHRTGQTSGAKEELVDVDDGYWGLLVQDAVRAASRDPSPSGEPLIELMVRVGKPLRSPQADGGRVNEFTERAVSSGALTREALSGLAQQRVAHVNDAADVALRIGDLLDHPPYSQFHIVGVIVELRLKRHPIMEVELCDADNAAIRITVVCFDESITNNLRRTLRGNGTERVELRGVLVVPKTARDVQYQANRHPMMLRISPNSFSVKVVGYIPGGVAPTATSLAPPQVVEVAPKRAVVALGSDQPAASSASRTTFLSLKSLHHGSSAASHSSSGASTGSGGGQSNRTMLRLMPPTLPSTASSSSSAKATVAPYQEPGVPAVSLVDVHQRDECLVRSERRLDSLREQGAKKRASTKCLLCGVDVEAPQAAMDLVRERLSRSRVNRGQHIPPFADLVQALADRRLLYQRLSTSAGDTSSTPITRFYCKTRFVDLLSGTCHLVHPRCVHLCHAYQRGESTIEDVALHNSGRICSLCQDPGATVRCYHPECREEYHVICALFSNGYVNFGKRDPLLPAPACPKHTQVKCPTLACRDENITAADRKRTRDDEASDSIVFDSGVVESGDLRDPDEEDH